MEERRDWGWWRKEGRKERKSKKGKERKRRKIISVDDKSEVNM